MSLDRIPEELRVLRQWVCADEDKRPLNPRNFTPASVLEPDTWGTFEEARLAGTKHVGFVLTHEDPYCIIDLDRPRNEVEQERHGKILDAFETYTERSQSGAGFHIICRGSLPEGARRDKVEVYSDARYMIMTGNITRDAPIVDCQGLLDILYSEIKRSTTTAQAIDGDETQDDAELVAMAMRAANGEKFNALCAGNMEGYPSQSEADMALLSILAFYSANNEQVKRLFRMSALGKRDKATKNDTYLNYAIKRIRANQPKPVDLEALAKSYQPPGKKDLPKPFSFPSGLIGDIAEYILHQAVRPVPEIALAGAITFFAGLVGRCYNISGTGLNQYLLVLAKTGCGKEGAMSGIERLTAAIRPQVPMVDEFIGPAAFASGQALIKTLDQHQSFVSVMGEFGLTLQHLSDPRANGSTIMLKKVLLDLYTKSGWDSVLRSSVYSDSEKNTKVVRAPCVTILGESTPEAFYEGISSSHIAEGLIPRFLVIEYKGGRPERNGKGNPAPSPELVGAMTKLVTQSLTMKANQVCHPVPCDAEAEVILDAFDRQADRHINNNQTDIEAQLWNRAHLKALKLAALVAVGMNWQNPVVNKEAAQWAVSMVKADVTGMLAHYQEGDVGLGDARQAFEVRRLVERFHSSPEQAICKYGVGRALYRAKVMPALYFQRTGYGLAAFRNDRLGAGVALKRVLDTMIDNGELIEVPKPQMVEKFGGAIKAYVLGPSWGITAWGNSE